MSTKNKEWALGKIDNLLQCCQGYRWVPVLGIIRDGLQELRDAIGGKDAKEEKITNSLHVFGYDAEGIVRVRYTRTAHDPQRDLAVAETAWMFREAVVIRQQTNITPEILWAHIMGKDWVTPNQVFYNRLPILAPGGETLGAPHPDWPEWCTTFNERLAYQHGVADGRLAPKQEGVTS